MRKFLSTFLIIFLLISTTASTVAAFVSYLALRGEQERYSTLLALYSNKDAPRDNLPRIKNEDPTVKRNIFTYSNNLYPNLTFKYSDEVKLSESNFENLSQGIDYEGTLIEIVSGSKKLNIEIRPVGGIGFGPLNCYFKEEYSVRKLDAEWYRVKKESNTDWVYSKGLVDDSQEVIQNLEAAGLNPNKAYSYHGCGPADIGQTSNISRLITPSTLKNSLLNDVGLSGLITIWSEGGESGLFDEIVSSIKL